MTFRPGEIVLIRIDFHQTPGGKFRPAVVLLDSADDDFAAANPDCIQGQVKSRGSGVDRNTMLATDERLHRLLKLADRGPHAQPAGVENWF